MCLRVLAGKTRSFFFDTGKENFSVSRCKCEVSPKISLTLNRGYVNLFADKKEGNHMRKFFAVVGMCAFSAVILVSLTGCTVIFQKGRRKDMDKITELQSEYTKLQDENSELARAKAELEDRLRNEINNKDLTVKMMEKGLVITFVSEVLFDSGKDALRAEAVDALQKIAKILNTTVRDLKVGVEGHTDNVPIKYSGWKSNWELSAARALSVLHFVVDDEGVNPDRISATGYGEYQPVSDNDSPEGRAKNRRVEIVIYPKMTKQASGAVPGAESEENLK